MKQTLTALYIENEKWVEKVTTCCQYGEMTDGRKVWMDETGRQYLRTKIRRRFYFVEL